MGSVSKVREAKSGKIFALKRIRDEQSGDAGITFRLKRECRAQMKISHPRVVRVHEYFEAEGAPAILMDYIEGETFLATPTWESPALSR